LKKELLTGECPKDGAGKGGFISGIHRSADSLKTEEKEKEECPKGWH